MKVSIIVPIYNVEAEIQHCLKSVLEQDYRNIELILVDDCSPDNSIHLAQQMVEAYDAVNRTIFIRHEKNRGLSAARNSGIDTSTGEFLFFLDSDDALSSTTVITELVALSKKNADFYDVVIGNFEKVTSSGEVLEVGFQKDFQSTNCDDIYANYVRGNLTVTAWGKLVSRDLLMKHQLYFEEGIYHEDELWSFLLYRYAKNVCATSTIVYDYLEREGSISFSIKEKNVVDLNFVIEKMYEIYLREENSFYKKLIAIKIEKLKRRSLKWMAIFKDAFIEQQIRFLKTIKTQITITETKYIEQSLLLNLPIKLAIFYIKLRWGQK
ncbi:glycosyltransferase family 2 protein [Ignatzschineria cameli]|uniref:glycosyltransferase family 2 protein n=1 Tax=Ignatzschineria cameli TaxID=2182793 RepID=UPI000D60760A|nr:glycosyltransferase family 2 protein [Ignatzschineria cameli]PWD85338.1 hypothetical protein DC080_06690 [Ignatzschineria cameli]